MSKCERDEKTKPTLYFFYGRAFVRTRRRVASVPEKEVRVEVGVCARDERRTHHKNNGVQGERRLEKESAERIEEEEQIGGVSGGGEEDECIRDPFLCVIDPF